MLLRIKKMVANDPHENVQTVPLRLSPYCRFHPVEGVGSDSDNGTDGLGQDLIYDIAVKMLSEMRLGLQT